MSKEHPILMSTSMVQATLEDRKTITRRTTGLDKINAAPNEWEIYGSTSGETGFVWNFPKPGDYSIVFRKKGTDESQYIKFPYGATGSILWVRECFLDADNYPCHPHHDEPETYGQYDYKADVPKEQLEAITGWKPSIHMPKSACRIFLKITDIRVERVQDISEADAISEGINFIDKEEPLTIGYELYGNHNIPDVLGRKAVTGTASESFCSLWQSINGEESWNSNPWVWVISFEKTNKPENWGADTKEAGR